MSIHLIVCKQANLPQVIRFNRLSSNTLIMPLRKILERTMVNAESILFIYQEVRLLN